MVSSFYASLLALWIVWLSLRVIKLRRKKRVPLGDGGDQELLAAIRTQGNATEYLPIAIILLVLLELNGGYFILIHIAGLALIAGRLLHLKALRESNIPYRVRGMQLTLFTIIGLAVVNIAYFIYGMFSSGTGY